MNGFNLSSISDLYVGGTEASAAYYGSSLIWSAVKYYYKTASIYEKEYLTIEMLENNAKIYIQCNGSSSFTSPAISISTSVNNGPWVTHDIPEKTSNVVVVIQSDLNIGDKVRLKANVLQWGNPNNDNVNHRIAIRNECKIYGNIFSLVRGDNFYKNYNVSSDTTTRMLGHVLQPESSSYQQKLKDVSNLFIPAIKANTNAGGQEYRWLLMDNKAITKAPHLDMASEGKLFVSYEALLNNCNSLTDTSNIDFNCVKQPGSLYYTYRYMFQNCTSLQKAPRINIYGANGDFYFERLFYGCSALTDLELNISVYNNNNFGNWLTNTTNLTTIKTNDTTRTGSNFTASSTKTLTQSNIKDPKYFTIESLEDNNTIELYIRDKYNMYWNIWVNGVETKHHWTGTSSTWNTLGTLNKGDIMQILQDTSTQWQPSASNSYSNFRTSGEFIVYGNLYTLIKNSTVTPNYSYYCAHLFKDCTKLVDARNLFLLSSSCGYLYDSMFEGCTSLERAPRVIQLTSPQYFDLRDMFRGCTKLYEGPEIIYSQGYSSNANIYDTENMFNGCANLEYVGIRCPSEQTSYKYDAQNWLSGTTASKLTVNTNIWRTSGTNALSDSDRSEDNVPLGATIINNKFIYD